MLHIYIKYKDHLVIAESVQDLEVISKKIVTSKSTASNYLKDTKNLTSVYVTVELLKKVNSTWKNDLIYRYLSNV